MFAFFQWIDRVVGKIVYRGLGILAAIVCLFSAKALYRDITNYGPHTSLVGIALLVTVIIITALVIRYCFSSKRTLGEFIAASEGDGGDAGNAPYRDDPPKKP